MQSSLQQSIEWIARGVDKENDYCESAFQLTVRSQFFLHIGFARYSAQLPARLFDARSFAPFSLLDCADGRGSDRFLPKGIIVRCLQAAGGFGGF